MKTALKFILPLAVLGAGGAIAALLIVSRPVASVDPPHRLLPVVEVLEVQPEDLRLTVATQGTVSPRTESTLVPEVSARVVRVSPSLAAGGFFETEEVLLELDPTDFELALTTAKARLAQAELNLVREEAEARVARSEWEKLSGGAPGRQPSPLTLREPQVAEARAALEAARAIVEQAARDVRKTRVRAPYAGRVREKHVDVGQFVTVGSPLARVYAVDHAEIRLPLANEDLAYLDLPLGFREEAAGGSNGPRPGRRGRRDGPAVTLTAVIGKTEHRWRGRVVRTEGEFDPRSRVIYAVARVDDPYGQSGPTSDRPPLAVGLFVRAEIEGKMAPGVVRLPRNVVRGDRNDEVLVVDDEQRLHFRRVDILRRQGDEVLVQGGLAAAERVCLTPLDVVVEDMRVRVRGEPPVESSTANEVPPQPASGREAGE